MSAASGFSPHAGILIDTNAGFNSANGVVSGDGTVQSPYIIENWEISGIRGQTEAAIIVQNTNAYFIIRHVYLHDNSRGVFLDNAFNATIDSSRLEGNDPAIEAYGGSMTISRNNVTCYFGGIVSRQGSAMITDNVILGSLTTGYSVGVYADGSDSVITRNRLSNSGVSAYSTSGPSKVIVTNNSVTGSSINISDTALIVNNTILNGHISVGSATNVTITDNTITVGGIDLLAVPSASALSLSRSNLVDGKPVYYYNGCTDVDLNGLSLAQLFVVNCKNVRANNLQLGAGDIGVYVAFVNHFTIQDSQSVGFMTVQYSSNVNASGCRFALSGTLGDNPGGIVIDHGTNITLSHDTALGINVLQSVNLRLSGNQAWHNDLYPYNVGISVSSSSNVRIDSNFVSRYHLGIDVESLTNVTVDSNNVSRNDQGIVIGPGIGYAGETNVKIAQNRVSYNDQGIVIDVASGLNVTRNTILHNAVGLNLVQTTLNSSRIYGNNFLFNIIQAEFSEYLTLPENLWDSGYPAGGNYWSDYRGVDQCSSPGQDICNGPDGIGDTPYTGLFRVISFQGGPFPLQTARYPLMSPVGSFNDDAKPPMWPSPASLNFTYINSSSARLAWTNATDDSWVIAYRVYCGNALTAIVAGASMNYTVRGLTIGQSYNFTIQAGDAGQNWSNNGPSVSFVFTRPSVPTGPAAPGSQTPPPKTGFLNMMTLSILAVGILVAIVAAAVIVVRTRKPAHEN